MADILVIGSLNMDLVVRAPRIPVPGETLQGEDLRTIPGGKGANQAAAAARLGANVAMAGKVGGDAFGPRLVDALRSAGVETGHIGTDELSATGTAVIVVAESGENIIVVSPGANGKLGPEDIRRIEPELSRSKVLLLQLEIPLDAVAAALETASRYDLKVILNPAPAKPIPLQYLSHIDVLIPNETEAETLTGLAVRDLESAEKAARRLQVQGIETVIITLGARGALLLSGDQASHTSAPQVEVVDTTAAGDAFAGGLAAALVEGRGIHEAVRFAVCAGALATTKLGAQTSMPTAADVESLLETEKVGA